jgi:membrane-associated phospholipid phosphatase
MNTKTTVFSVILVLWALHAGPEAGAFWDLFLSTGTQSPYELRWGKEAVMLGTTAAFHLGSSFYFNSHAPLDSARIAGLSVDDVSALDRGAVYNAGHTAPSALHNMNVGLTFLPALLLLERGPRRDLVVLGLMYAETILLSGAVSNLTKEFSRRPRPFVYNTGYDANKQTTYAHHSFISGHSTFAFAMMSLTATVFRDYHRGSPWVPVVYAGCAALATLSSSSRYLSGDHFPTDLLAGAVVGALSGWGVPKLHARRAADTRLSVFPIAGREQGLRLALEF